MKTQPRPLNFPEATTLSDLFDRIEVLETNEDPIGPTPIVLENKTAQVWCKGTVIGSYCATHRLKGRTKWLRVKPNAAMVAVLSKRAMTDYDTISFGLVERGDGRVLVTASSNKILQSIWLAILPDTSSIPANLFEEEEEEEVA